MGQLNAFTYVESNSFVNALDVRYKLVCMSFLSLATLKGSLPVLALITAIILGAAANLRIRPVPLLSALKPFFFLLALVFISRSLTTPGETVLGVWGITATRQGVVAGIIVSWRFFLVMMLGIIFSKSTKPTRVKGAVQWFLRPVPFVDQARVAVMVSLFLRFLPMILLQASEVSQAQRSRCSALKKNPIKKMLNISTPLLRKTFQSADRMADAMAARCYNDDRTDPEFFTSAYDTAALGLCLFILIIAFLS